MQPQPDGPAESLTLSADGAPFPVRGANVENWIVERRLPHCGHSGLPFFAVTMRSKRDLHSSQTYS